MFREIWKSGKDKYECVVDDIDGDGLNELIAAHKKRITVYRNFKKIKDFKVDCEIFGFVISDLDNDGVKELFVTDGNKGVAYENWEKIMETELGLSSIWLNCAVGDINNDGTKELIIAGQTTTKKKKETPKPKIVAYSDWQSIWSPEIEGISFWATEEKGGGFLCLDIGDADNDGKDEVIAGTVTKRIHVFKDGKEKWSGRANTGTTEPPTVNACVIGDALNDNKNEIITGAGDNTLRIFKEEKQVWKMKTRDTPRSIAIGDVDNDGENEIVMSYLNDEEVTVLKKGKILWDDIVKDHSWDREVIIADVDNDGKNEIIATGDRIRIFKYSPS